MSKKSKRAAKEHAAAHEAPAKARHPVAPVRSKHPNWPLLVLAALGALDAGYLTYTAWYGAHPLYCEAGGGCDIVQSSHWATFLGAPTAFWGLLTYLVIGFVAARVRNVSLQWQLAWVVALVGWGVSVYLTAISVLVLKATCPYCLSSLGILTVMLALLTFRRPEGIARFAWPGWLAQTAAVALIVVAGMHFMYSGILNPAAGPETPYLKGLAIRVSESGAKFYGASWCPHCQHQKELFGASVGRLPYVECSATGSPEGGSTPACIAQNISSYPTWIFANGDRVTAVLEPDDLARRVGYTTPPDTK